MVVPIHARRDEPDEEKRHEGREDAKARVAQEMRPVDLFAELIGADACALEQRHIVDFLPEQDVLASRIIEDGQEHLRGDDEGASERCIRVKGSPASPFVLLCLMLVSRSTVATVYM